MCVDKLVSDLKRSDCTASEKAGFKPYVKIVKYSDILTWCGFGNSTDIAFSENQKKLVATGDIILKANKKWSTIEAAEVGMIKLSSKKNGNAWTSELKIRLQNSLESRGWSKGAIGARLVILSFETEGDKPLLIGHSDGYYAEVKKDGAEAEFGEKYSDDKYLDITFTYEPELPFVYVGAIDEVEV